jgi:predicted amidophosphoribosyltransferase
MSHTLRSVVRMLRSLSDDLLALLLPGKCPGCGGRGEPVCAGCAATMRAAPPGRPIPGVSWSVAAFAYEGVARELIARVKYRNERIAVRWLGAKVAQCCLHAPLPFDVVTWIPASAMRRSARGIDHGELLAREVASGLDLTPKRLLRRDNGPPQTGRALEERRAGPTLLATGEVAGRSVLVVDDVTTTGATLAAAARVLHACGALDVSAAAGARTPGPADRAPDAAYTPNAVSNSGRSGRSRG